MPHFSRPDAQVYYDISGVGSPVLMLAGIASDGASWGPLLPYLDTEHELVRMDNRGAGQTKYDGPISADQILDDAEALLDHLQLHRVRLLGHSMGGMLALRLAERLPGRIKRVAVLSAAPSPVAKTTALLDDMIALQRLGIDRRLWFSLFYQWLFAPPFFENRDNVEKALDASLAYPFLQSPEDFERQVEMVRALTPLDLSEVLPPVLAIAGSEDLLAQPNLMRQELNGLPRLSFEVIEGAGHSVHWDNPGAVARLLRGFLPF